MQSPVSYVPSLMSGHPQHSGADVGHSLPVPEQPLIALLQQVIWCSLPPGSCLGGSDQ